LSRIAGYGWNPLCLVIISYFHFWLLAASYPLVSLILRREDRAKSLSTSSPEAGAYHARCTHWKDGVDQKNQSSASFLGHLQAFTIVIFSGSSPEREIPAFFCLFAGKK
jgi:hypothetical protein